MSEWCQLKRTKEASLSSPKQITHTTNTLDHALIFLKCMVNEHVFMNLISLGQKFQPSQILKFGKLVGVCFASSTCYVIGC